MARIMVVLIASLVVSACATRAAYDEIVFSWLGSTEERLVASWGYPEKFYENGDLRVLIYDSSNTVTRIDPVYVPPYYPSPPLDGAAAGYPYVSPYPHTNPYATPTTTTTTYWCTTTFRIKKKVIVSAKTNGNACRA